MNPYQEWLGRYDLTEHSQPNHYELLGIPLFEKDTQRINSAADELLGRIRAVRPGANMPQWSKLQSDIQAARDCLINRNSRKEYERQLGGPASSTATNQALHSSAAVASGYGQYTDYQAPTMSSFGTGSTSPAAPASVPASMPTPTPTPTPSAGTAYPSYDPVNLNSIPPASSTAGAPVNGYPTGSYPQTPAYPQAPAGAAYPQAPAGAAYPQAPAGAAYPQAPAGAAYPQAPAGSAYPQAPAGSAYPQAPAGSAYPQAPAGSAYPQAPAGSAYPQAPAGSAYPQAPAGSAYPQAPAGSAYPQAPAGSAYPQTPAYPQAPGASAYPQVSAYPQAPVAGYPQTPAPAPYPEQTPAPVAPAQGPQSTSIGGNVTGTGISSGAAVKRRYYGGNNRSPATQIALNIATIIGVALIIFLGYQVWLKYNSSMNESLNGDTKVAQRNAPVVIGAEEKNDTSADDGQTDTETNTDAAADGESGNSAENAADASDAEKADTDTAEADAAEAGTTTEKPAPAAETDKPVSDQIELIIDDGTAGNGDATNAPAANGPVDPAKLSAYQEAIANIRQGLQDIDPDYSADLLAKSKSLAQTPEQQKEVERLEDLTECIKSYKVWLSNTMAKSNMEELKVGNTFISIIEMNAEGATVRANGENRSYTIQTMTPKFVNLLVRNNLSSAVNKALYGAFLCVHPNGDRLQAKKLWQQATAEGEDCTNLMPELTLMPVRKDTPVSSPADNSRPQVAGRRPAGNRTATAGNTAGSDSAASAGTTKLPVPNTEKQNEALTKVKLTFKAEYGANVPKTKETLSEQLSKASEDSKFSVEEQYVMLDESSRLALEVNRPGLACDALSLKEKKFETNTYQQRLAIITKADPDARGKISQKDVLESASQLLEEAYAAKKTEDCKKLIGILKITGNKSGMVQYVRKAMEAEATMK